MALRALRQFTRAADGLAEWTGRVVSWFALVMVLIGGWNALARWAGRRAGFDLSSNSLIEVQWYLFSLMFLLAAPYTLKRDEHVRVDVFYGRLGARGQAWTNFLGGLLLLLPFCATTLVFVWPGVVESWSIREGSPDPGGLPRYPLKAAVPVALVLLFIQGVSEVIKSGLVLFSRAPEAASQQPEDA